MKIINWATLWSVAINVLGNGCQQQSKEKLIKWLLFLVLLIGKHHEIEQSKPLDISQKLEFSFI